MYRNESLLNGRMMTLPRVTVDPCWPSRLISELIVGLVLMLLSNCRGPRTLSALFRRTDTSCGSSVVVESHCAASQAGMLLALAPPPLAPGEKVWRSTNCGLLVPGRGIST